MGWWRASAMSRPAMSLESEIRRTTPSGTGASDGTGAPVGSEDGGETGSGDATSAPPPRPRGRGKRSPAWIPLAGVIVSVPPLHVFCPHDCGHRRGQQYHGRYAYDNTISESSFGGGTAFSATHSRGRAGSEAARYRP